VTSEPARIEEVRIEKLKKFLRNPIESSIQRHLRLYDEVDEPPGDDEPFYSVFPTTWACRTTMLSRFAAKAAGGGVDAAMETFDRNFDDYFDNLQVTGEMPEGAFGEIDKERLRDAVREKIDLEGDKGLAAFLRMRHDKSGTTFHSRLIIGKGRKRAEEDGGIDLTFPPLILKPPPRGGAAE